MRSRITGSRAFVYTRASASYSCVVKDSFFVFVRGARFGTESALTR